ncbi:3-deoxy-7-phosphoheptulonate synthase [[Clostridium] colinum]|uniref:3-deoxy-7-phosphoheptulonate synthase n=1 Tax=[Clostridium] colinum TaxID=36835 RepID=UPI002025059B|nr:3-deoxy-7-phosphoheptulonate synthase [[Clostridium] colinum]
MSFKKISKIPTKEEIFDLLPLDKNLKNIKLQNDKEIKNILSSKSNKMLVIIGPCSADNEKSVCEYLDMLYKINEQVKEKLFIVPRIYTSKPRTTGDGYKGMIHQHNINSSPSMKDGIIAIRKLDIKIIKNYGFPIADEMLYTFSYPFFEDLLSYVAIGARSVENQQHRIMASGIDCAIGMKNPINGDISTMFNAIYTAQKTHNFIYDGYEVNTTGNIFTHGILRGSVDLDGNHCPNYYYESLLNIANLYNKSNLKNKSLIIDANHSNSGKVFYKQPEIVKDVLKSINKNNDLKNIIKGFMIESYIKEGSDCTGKTYGKSITDPCLNIDDTKKLLFNLAEYI